MEVHAGHAPQPCAAWTFSATAICCSRAGFGGTAYAPEAWQATREQQIAVAEKVQAAPGWGAWPACTSKLGLRFIGQRALATFSSGVDFISAKCAVVNYAADFAARAAGQLHRLLRPLDHLR